MAFQLTCVCAHPSLKAYIVDYLVVWTGMTDCVSPGSIGGNHSFSRIISTLSVTAEIDVILSDIGKSMLHLVFCGLFG